MQIVIDIPQYWFDDMVREEFCEVDELCAVIQHGIVLPEHHGDLKDVNTFEASCFMGSSMYYTQSDIEYAETIIPATGGKDEADNT